MQHTHIQKWSAEFLGTFWLTFGGCGSAVLAAAFLNVGIGLLGVSLASASRSSPAPTPSARSRAGTSTRPCRWAWPSAGAFAGPNCRAT